MYNYQEETVENIEEAVSKMEEMTEEHYRVHIGFRHTNNFDEENIPIYVEVNGRFLFTQQTNLDSLHGCYTQCLLRNYNRVELNKNVFLDLNHLIDKIIKDNRKRQSFYENLNKELKAFNIALDEVK